MPDWNPRANALFLAALDRPPADRPAFLALECGEDAAIRKAVETLLHAHEKAGDFLEQPAPDAGLTQSAIDFITTRDPNATCDSVSDAEVGAVIAGRYKLLERIGEGGMGSVWMAEQTEPVKRKVAVKLIKGGLDTRTVLARFEAERQALALMDHPNISKVFDGGVHDHQPFFVMELVKGVPITDFCDARKLTPQQRLELFVPVCQAIQHAHQKGVIHRDIKPANVLVALYDDKPVPKVIDFGVAKATGPTLTEHTLNTGFGGIVGTPQYMSPEQATFNNLDIDTRSDVYSLGVLLYELLAGSPPFKQKELEKRGLMEMLRVVREEEPPRPSTKLSTADALPSLSANRGMEPRKLTGLLRNELDWIVMKALEKDRTRRYETANGFAMDVTRYLSGEPVQAHPPTVGYRLRKFVRKNRVQVIAGAVVFAALLAGIVGTTFGLLEAKKQEAEATKQAGIARDEAEKKEQARADEAEQRAAAVASRNDLWDGLDAMTSGITGDTLVTQPAVSEGQKKFLDNVLPLYRKLADQTGDDEATRGRVARAAYRVGIIESRLGRKEAAVTAYRQARAEYQKLAADFPAVPDYRSALVHSHTNLGLTLAGLGQRADAEAEYRAGLARQAQLAVDFPAQPARRADLALCHNTLGNLLADLGKRDEAVGEQQTALALQAKLAADFPAQPEYRARLTTIHNDLANALVGLWRRGEAEEQYRTGLAVAKKLAADFPAVPAYRHYLATIHNNLGELLRGLGRRAEAEAEYRDALALRDQLAADFPAEPEYRVSVGCTCLNLGNMVREGGQPADSLAWYDKAIDALRPVHEAEPRAVLPRRYLRNSYWGRAKAFDQLKEYAAAVTDWDRLIDLIQGRDQLPARALRATSKVNAGRVAEAVAEVAELRTLSGWNATQWYDFACVYSVASAKVADKKPEYAAAAMELIRQAVKAGFKNAAHMKQDTDLDPLRDRDDFRKLLADLETKSPPKRETLPAPRADK